MEQLECYIEEMSQHVTVLQVSLVAKDIDSELDAVGRQFEPYP